MDRPFHAGQNVATHGNNLLTIATFLPRPSRYDWGTGARDMAVGMDGREGAAIDAIIARLYDAAFEQPLASFQDFALDAIRPAVQFDSAVWMTGVHVTNQVNSLWYHRRKPVNVTAYMTRFTEDDTVRTAALADPGTPYRIEDTRPLAEYYASDTYRAIGRLGGMEHVMGVSRFNTITRLSHYLVFYGHDRVRPFSEQDRAGLKALAPHVIAAWRHRQIAGMLEHPLPRQGDDEPGLRGRAIVDYRGVIEAADDEFGVAVKSEFPAWLGPQLPEPFCHLLAGQGDGARIGKLDVQLTRSPQCCVMTIAERASLAALTAAERRVARLFASGATQAAIATRLGISRNTVRNQLASAYEKLEIHSKVELARRFPR